jgi:hypothetical protein
MIENGLSEEDTVGDWNNGRHGEPAIMTVAVIDLGMESHLPPWVDSLRTHLLEVESKLIVRWLALVGPRKTNAYDSLDIVICSRHTRDWGRGLNMLVSSIRSPFVLWGDNNWRFDLPGRQPFCQMVFEALHVDDTFSQIKLHTDDNLRFTDRSIYSGPVVDLNGIPFYVQSPRKIWGGITLQPSIVKLEAIHELGPFREGALDWEDVAAEYSARSAQTKRHLVLRAAGLTPFSSLSAETYVSQELVVEGP